MTHDQALDASIRHARYLLFDLDGPIRSAVAVEPADEAAPMAPYIHEVFAACLESGRSIVVISNSTKINVRNYLDAHDLFTQITVIAISVADAIGFLELAPADCLHITSSAVNIAAAKAAGVPSIGYARTAVDAADLVNVGAVTCVYSMTDIALALRAHTPDL